MSWNGFLPGVKCKSCNKPLSGQDGPRPAESYAGTYTGLCYTCQEKNDFTLQTYKLDGAKLVSTPPSCPSWRRERETYHAYDDCQACKGAGYKWVSRSCASGGSYRHYCETCINRFCAHPVRKQADAILARRATIIKAAESRWNRELLAEVKKRKLTKKKKLSCADLLALLPKEVAEEMTVRVKADGQKALDFHAASKAVARAKAIKAE